MAFFENSIACPNCRAILKLDSRTLKCQNNHTFDIAKEGYVNLLLVNQKRSKHPGDNKIMVNARRSFLEGEFYAPLVSKLSNLVEQICIENDLSDIKVLDVGCGEGYYMASLQKKLTKNTAMLGFDISKEAIKMASKKYKDLCFFVASVKQMPIISNSINFIISIFSPIKEDEFFRVLRNNGYVIIVTPNTKHLTGLTNIIYANHNNHNSSIENYNKQQFRKIFQDTVRFNIPLTSKEDIMNLFMMTPYFYSTSKAKSEVLKTYNSLHVLADFEITVLKKDNR